MSDLKESMETQVPKQPAAWMAWKVTIVELQLAKLALAVRDVHGMATIDGIRKITIEDFLNRMIPNGVGLGPTKVVVPE